MTGGQDFETWRGVYPELIVPPTVRARFDPREFVHPTYTFELNAAAFGLLRQLVQDAADRTNQPSDELLALVEAVEAVGD